jgi:hypothetical protein
MHLGAMRPLTAFFEPVDMLRLRQPGNCESHGITTAADLPRMQPTAKAELRRLTPGVRVGDPDDGDAFAPESRGALPRQTRDVDV